MPILNIPNEFKCPITKLIMMEPFLCVGDGYTYELDAIDDHLKMQQNNPKSPMTNKVLTDKTLVLNQTLCNQIRQCLSENPELFDTNEEDDQVYFAQKSMLKAIAENDHSKVKLFFRLDKRFLTRKIEPNLTALQYIAVKGTLDLLKAVITSLTAAQKKLAIDVSKPIGEWQPTFLNELLLEAVKTDNKDLVETCLKLHAHLQAIDKTWYDSSALHMAAKHGYAEIAKILIESGAVIEAECPGDKSTPLNFAAYFGHASVIKILAEKGAQLGHQDNQGNTPIHDAMSRGHKEAAWALYQLNANTKTWNKAHQTPLEINPAMRQWFIEKKSAFKQEQTPVNENKLIQIENKLAALTLVVTNLEKDNATLKEKLANMPLSSVEQKTSSSSTPNFFKSN